MNARQKIARMLGEFLREAAVLTAVFVPLVRLVEQEKPLTFWWLFITLMVSVTLLAVGILIEVRIRE
jgi:uncharacterized membrane protein YczE